MLKREALKRLNDELKENFNDQELVLGDGDINSKVILIGEAPGANEVKEKKPFVGQAGKYLDEFIEISGLKREDIYITNAVKFRPTRMSAKTGNPVNRPPKKAEVEAFKTFLFRELDIINGRVVVTLGNTPLQAILGDRNAKIGDCHGALLEVTRNHKIYRLFPLYHPAAVIYNRKLKEVYLEDLHGLREKLNGRFL